VISVFGVTVGLHRLFTHQGFQATRALKIGLAVASTASAEGTVSTWVANHRVHHKLSDTPGDPHSPFYDNAGETTTPWAGLWHSHAGWLFTYRGAPAHIHAPDIVADADLAKVDRWFPALLAMWVLVIPATVGAFTGGLRGAMLGVIWAGLVRMSATHNVTWFINSVCHSWGARPWATGDASRNVWWLALVTAGESWHNNHHQFPNLARHGFGPRQIDLSAGFIRICERLGWASKVRWPSQRLVERLSELSAAKHHEAVSLTERDQSPVEIR
jgi:stearoyl-CoA desaturase (delta-9 desaturase)